MGCEIFMMGRCQKETRIWRDEVVVRERERERFHLGRVQILSTVHIQPHTVFSLHFRKASSWFISVEDSDQMKALD